MITDHALGLLLAWTSPSYPVGAFSYSHGLEAAVEDGSVRNAATLTNYIEAVISRGGGWVDAVLFVHAWRASSPKPSLPRDGQRVGARVCSQGYASPHCELAKRGVEPLPATPAASQFRVEPPPGVPSRAGGTTGPELLEGRGEEELDAIAELAIAFRGSSETALESRQMGRSFLAVTRAAYPHPALDAFAKRHAGRPIAHSIAGALACAAHSVPLRPALSAWVHATAVNLVSAGVRLVPLGQTDGQHATARLLPVIEEVTSRALVTDLDALGTSAMLVELASLAHETQYTRLFRS